MSVSAPQPSLLGENRFAHTRPLSIGVLVLNYGTWDLALQALETAIGFESDTISEYVLFDDGSPTPPPATINSRIRLIRGDRNRGFAGALRAAFTHVRSDVVVVFDSDAYPLAPFAACVRERFEKDNRLGQLGFFAQGQNGSPTESYLSEPTKWSLILGQQLYALVPKRSPRQSNLCVTTGSMATRLEAYAQVGGFDENLDFLDVDVDYSMRLRRNGWKVATDPSLKAFHVGGGTPQLQRLRVLRFYKSRWHLLRKHHLITYWGVARAFILTRLFLERLFLRVFGTFLFHDREVLADKIRGRRELISYCRQHYR